MPHTLIPLGSVLRSVACVLGVSVALSACSAEDALEPGTDEDFAAEKPVALRSGGGAIKVPQAFANVVLVQGDRLIVPRTLATERVLDTLKPGTVIAGNRDVLATDLAVSKNPSGFLRKVVSLSAGTEGAIITTTRAYLNELLEEGDLVFSATSPGVSIFEDAPAISQGLTLAGPSGRSSGSGETNANVVMRGPTGSVRFSPMVTLSNSKVALGAKVEGKIQLRRVLGAPLGVQRANLRLDVDPTVVADVEIGGKLSSAQSEVGGTLNETWEGPSVPIPVGGPIPLTLRLRPEVGCRITAKGEGTVTTRVTMTGHVSAGIAYLGGADLRTTSDPPRLETKHELVGLLGKAGLAGECTLQAVVSLLAFDAIGIEAKVGPSRRSRPPFAPLRVRRARAAGSSCMSNTGCEWTPKGASKYQGSARLCLPRRSSV